MSQDFTGYDYFDFGCSYGGNMVFTKKVYPLFRGLGIDLDADKIAKANANSHEAIIYDILRFPEQKLVKFVTMVHFLEHLDGLATTKKVIAKAISVATDFIFIRQPWFDADGFLFEAGLKFYWSHWRGHRNKMTTLDFYTILMDERKAGRIRSFRIFGNYKVTHSDDTTIVPLGTLVDQHHYNAMEHGKKELINLPIRAFKEVIVVININDGLSMAPLVAILGKNLELIFDSARAT